MIISVPVVIWAGKAFLKKDCHFGGNLKTKYLLKEEIYSNPYFLTFLLMLLKDLCINRNLSTFFCF